MEELTALVSSRGLLKSCATRNRQPISSNAGLDPDFAEHHRAGGSIYVCTDALAGFVKERLPRIATPFTLVSGDSDVAVSPDALGSDVFDGILSNELCRAWFAQNASARHPKLFALPIGLDYHTMWERPGMWGITRVSPQAQERQLVEIWARSPEPHQRYLAGYCNWAGTLDRGDRRECLERVDRSVLFVETGQVPRAGTWARQAEFLFVLSPAGAGVDCHRTWEALLLGCIPIVKRSRVSDLLARLPVLIVDDWSQVRRATLEAFVSGMGAKTFEFSSLFRENWTRAIHALPPPTPLELTYADFRRWMTRVTG